MGRFSRGEGGIRNIHPLWVPGADLLVIAWRGGRYSNIHPLWVPEADKLLELWRGRVGSLPVMLNMAGAWLEQSGRKSMIVEIPDQWIKIRDNLLENGWKKQFIWLELVRWLEE